MKWNIRNGFTIIELIVVLSILSVILLIAIPKYKGYIPDFEGAKYSFNFEVIETAMMRYKIDVGDYPDTPMILNTDPGFFSNVENKENWRGPYIDSTESWKELFPKNSIGSYVNGKKDKEIFIGSGVYRIYDWMLESGETKEMYQVLILDNIPYESVERMEKYFDKNNVSLDRTSVDNRGKIRYKSYDSKDEAVVYYILEKTISKRKDD